MSESEQRERRPESPAARPWLERLALHRPELRAWALYDWANSAMFTVVVTAVFPIFYTQVAAAGLDAEARRSTFGWATTISLIVAALISPVLGALADFARLKKTLFTIFLAIGVTSTAAMFWLGPGDWRLAQWLFGLANFGAAGSFVFYDAMLSHVARPGELDRLSTSAYAVGYVGGGLCLALCLVPILWPATLGLDPAERSTLPARLAFLFTAIWWLVFSVPYLRRVREPPLSIEADEARGMNPVRVAFTRLAETFRDLRRYRQAFLFLVAFLIYSDGIGTIIRLATLLGEQRQIETEVMIVCILVVQFVGVPCAVLFSRLAERIGAKHGILIALAAYAGISLLATRMETERDFMLLAACVGMVQGGSQALSRSLFASLVPKHKSGEFFGLFSTLEKFAGILGPLIFTLVPGALSLALLAFFALGALLLWRVDVEAGRRVVREVEAQLKS